MKRLFSVLIVGLALSAGVSTSAAKTAEEYIGEGENLLFALTDQSALQAHGVFKEAAGIYPDHPVINAYLAVTRLLDLGLREDQTGLTELFSQFGISREGDGPETLDLSLPENSDGDVLLPETAPSGETVRSFLAGEFLAALDASISNLDTTISNWTVSDKHVIPKEKLGDALDVEFDPGEIYLFRAVLKAAKAAALIVTAYDLDVDVREIFSLDNLDADLSIILDRYPQFLTLLAAGEDANIAEAKTALLGAIEDYLIASDRIRNDSSTETGAEEMIVIDYEDEEDETLFRDNLAKVQISLNSSAQADLILESAPEEEHLVLNLNNFFTSVPPDLRDFLPEFNAYGEEIADTMGHGLGDDATLGGILPEFTQEDWELEDGACGEVAVPNIEDGSIYIDGDSNDWSGIQPVFTDAAGNDDPNLGGTDIAELYLSKDNEFLYGSMVLHEAADQDVFYEFAAAPNYGGIAAGERIVRIGHDDGRWYASVLEVEQPYSWNEIWRSSGSDNAAAVSGNIVEWKVPLVWMGNLSGKFVQVTTRSKYTYQPSEDHLTCLKIQPTTSVNGTVSVPGHDGQGPVYVGVYRFTGSYNRDPDNRIGRIVIYPDGYSSGMSYSITGLPIGEEVFVTALWDADVNGVVTPGDYTDYSQVFTTQAAANQFDANLDARFTDPSDVDEDGLVDEWEIEYFGNTTSSDGSMDTDGDGLNDREESLLGTNPLFNDTDGDRLLDREEVRLYDTDPQSWDSNGDGRPDGADVPISTCSIWNEHSHDGSMHTVVAVMIHPVFDEIGSLPGDIDTIMITGPGGVLPVGIGDFDYYPQWRMFLASLPGPPLLGEYTIAVSCEDSWGRKLWGVSRDVQTVTRTVPLPETAELSPAAASKTPTFIWGDPELIGKALWTRERDAEYPIYYRFEVRVRGETPDLGGHTNMSEREKGMLFYTAPANWFTPGVEYEWRVTAWDDPDFKRCQNRAATEWQPFTMDSSVSHSADPVIDPERVGVMTYNYNTPEGAGLLFWVRIIDQDGVASDGSSHSVYVTGPGVNHQVFYDPSNRQRHLRTPTSGVYSRLLSNVTPETGDYVFSVIDPDGKSSTFTENLSSSDIAVIDPPDVTTLSPSSQGEFVTMYVDNVLVNGALYDDFNSYTNISDLDTGKWINYCSGGSISDGSLIMQNPVSVGGSDCGLSFTNSESIHSIQADIKVPVTSSNFARGRIGGWFFNNGNGDVFAEVSVRQNIVRWQVTEFPRADSRQFNYLANEDLLSVSQGETIQASIEWDEINKRLNVSVKNLDKPESFAATHYETLSAYPLIRDTWKGISARVSLFVEDTTPTFTLDSVSDASTLSMRIYDFRDDYVIWQGAFAAIGATTMSITIPPGVLDPHTFYRADIRGVKEHSPMDIDNYSRAPAQSFEFMTGSQDNGPLINLSDIGVETWSQDDLATPITTFRVQVHDAQGVPGDIASVTVTFPDGETVINMEPATWDPFATFTAASATYSGVYTGTIQEGDYIFSVQDKSGSPVYSVTETLISDPVGYPPEMYLSPTHNTLLDTAGGSIPFDWDDVPGIGIEGVGFYRVEIFDYYKNPVYQFATTESSLSVPAGYFKKDTVYRYRITTRKEFFDQNVDNASVSPPGYDSMPMFIVGDATLDTDGDGIVDAWETAYGLDAGVNDSGDDPDSDGLNNLAEYEAGTDPFLADTDGDGRNDAREVAQGTDPNSASSYAGIPDIERDALIAVYYSAGGSNWFDSSGWLGEIGSECTWHGVTCDGAGQHVGFLYLGSNNLSGTIPSELENLDHLVGLNLYGNQLTGSIPAELGNLIYLTALDLHSNQLIGNIPEQLGNLSYLEVLDLHSNQLSGTIPVNFQNLSNLSVLNLSDNRLSGAIPAELGNLSNLELLYLNQNEFFGGVPMELGSLSLLERLYLNGNKLTGEIPVSLAGLPSMVENGMDIGWNGLHTEDAALRDFLIGIDPDWGITQTVAPADLSVDLDSVTIDSVQLSWTPIDYTGDTGNYVVEYGTISGGPYTSGVTTASKADSGVTVAGLSSGTTYYFRVRTVTQPHENNLNTVYSEYTGELSVDLTDTDGDGIPDVSDGDDDDDGLSDEDEATYYGTDPRNPDTDSDGMPDAWEVQYVLVLNPLADDAGTDPDSDGLSNLDEYLNYTDPNNPDTDGDGYYDGEELVAGSDPNSELSMPVLNPGNYYVDASSSGIGTGTSENPWQSLHYAVNRINDANPATGDSSYFINVAPGNYSLDTVEPDKELTITQNQVYIIGEKGEEEAKPILDGTGASSWKAGIYVSGSPVYISNLEIRNFSEKGIGIIESNQAGVSECDIHDNTYGIEIYMADTAWVESCNVFSNGADGIRISESDNIVITGCEVYDCNSGIWATSSGSVSILDSLVHENSETGIGVEDCTAEQQVLIQGCEVYGQIAGQGIALINSSPWVMGNRIWDNGSGIHVYAYETAISSPLIENNLVYLTGEVNNPNGIWISEESGGIVNPSIYHNTIHGGGGPGTGLFLNVNSEEGRISPAIKYNIVTAWGDYGIENSGGTPVLDYNDFWGNGTDYSDQGLRGPDDISADPRYSDESNNDLTLQESSPCVDAVPLASGDSTFIDIEGSARPFALGFDMGCYESPFELFRFISTPLVIMDEDSSYGYVAQVNRSDVIFSLVDGPEGMDIDSGRIIYCPASDAECGDHTVELMATSSGLTAYQTFTLAVVPVNDRPYIYNDPAPVYAMPGRLYTVNLWGEDEESSCNELEFRLDRTLDPPSTMEIVQDGCDAVIRWMPEEGDAGRMLEGLEAGVSDGLLVSEPMTFSVTVLDDLRLSPERAVLVRSSEEEVSRTFEVLGGWPGEGEYHYQIIYCNSPGSWDVQDSGYLSSGEEGRYLIPFSTGDRLSGEYRIRVTYQIGEGEETFTYLSEPIEIRDVTLGNENSLEGNQVDPFTGDTLTVDAENVYYKTTIRIPAGSGESGTTVEFTFKMVVEGEAYSPEAPKGVVVEIKATSGGEDVAFSSPIEITLPYSAFPGIEADPRVEDLKVYRYDTDRARWVPVTDYALDRLNRTITFRVTRFSEFMPIIPEKLVRTINGGITVEDYQIFSVPAHADNTSLLTNLTANLGSYDDTLWRCFAYNKATGAYDEVISYAVDQKYPLEPGRAFWLISRYTRDITVEGLTIDNDAPFEYKLHPGWNMIANPYYQDVYLDSIWVSDDGVNYSKLTSIANGLTDTFLYKFDPHTGGEGETIWYSELDPNLEPLEPGKGYWLRNRSSSDVILRFEPLLVDAKYHLPLHKKAVFLARNSFNRLMDAFATVCMAGGDGASPPPPPYATGSSSIGGSAGSIGVASGGGGCFIATAAYGSILHPHVRILREFRDRYMLPSSIGARMVEAYYAYSPRVAGVISQSNVLRMITCIMLVPFVFFCALALYTSLSIKLLMLSALLIAGFWAAQRRGRRIEAK